MKQKRATKIFISVKKYYKPIIIIAAAVSLYTLFVFSKKAYNDADFGKTFGTKAIEAEKKMAALQEGFDLCASLCHEKPLFLQSIVFPELMRYNQLKDGIETESLRTLYVQFGEEYANFSIGLFQMKPSFAIAVETKAKQLFSDSIYQELQLDYINVNEQATRQERVERLGDENWQQVYLCAFVCICNEIYKAKTFTNEIEKLQWYATVYNAGFDKADSYIVKKIAEDNFYLTQGMPNKKFRYAAIVKWFYTKN
jgi:hypothetical protein